MNIAPFKIKKLSLDGAQLRVETRTILGNEKDAKSSDADFPGYFVVSTAPPNIEDAEPTTTASIAQATGGLEAIARDLHRIQSDPTIEEPAELVIAVHGYNTLEVNVREWYTDIYRYIARTDRNIRHRRNLVFVGYRWSSERLSAKPRHLWNNLRALPDVPQFILGIGGALVILYWGWTLLYGLSWLGTRQNVLLQLGFSLAIATTMIISTLLILRITGYFRDVYRAINFGVPDLTELIRQIDRAVINERVEDLREKYSEPEDALTQAKLQKAPQKIQLNFLGHSMGGLVITNVVRILSDVFDTRSINQTPSSEIGYTLSLGRLILASPDIPVLSIISSRANGLASSLRRFNEAYLFSNEGDLALRLASTAANYISFPSGKQQYGHRLGSVALINSLKKATKSKQDYFQIDVLKKGIINLSALQQHYALSRTLEEAITADPNDILKCLFITHSSGKDDGYLSLYKLFKMENSGKTHATLADLFTFFDCTDYKDKKLTLSPNGRRVFSKGEVGLLTRANARTHLKLWDYIELVIDSIQGKRDVHGGYFKGEYSRQLIYRLAFLGFEDGLRAGLGDNDTATPAQQNIPDDHLPTNDKSMAIALDTFNKRCMETGIQVYLSPLRYRVDIQGKDITETKEDLIKIMKTKPLVEPVEIAPSSSSDPSSSSSSMPSPPPSPESAPLAK
ncbi:MAG: alpha/beta hydrolase [Cyanobacteria bacterium J06634_5]